MTESNLAPLYHGTFKQNISPILMNNVLNATSNAIYNSRPGISLTRSFAVASRWAGEQGMVLEFDQQRLKANHKIIPINQLHYPEQLYHRTAKEEELAEERVIGDIRNLKKYLTAIHLSKFYLNNELPDQMKSEYGGLITIKHRLTQVPKVQYFS